MVPLVIISVIMVYPAVAIILREGKNYISGLMWQQSGGTVVLPYKKQRRI